MGSGLPSPPVKDLLRAYVVSREALRQRGVIRSNKSFLSDYAEWLAAKALNLTLAEGGSNKGYDATDRQGRRYQVKARQMTAVYQQPDLRGFGDMDADHFDFLVAIIVDADFEVLRAVVVPFVEARARVKGPRMYLGSGLVSVPGVRDVTDRVRKASES